MLTKRWAPAVAILDIRATALLMLTKRWAPAVAILDIRATAVLMLSKRWAPAVAILDIRATALLMLTKMGIRNPEVGSAIFLGGALSLECYLCFYVR
jgi:hypothetical protein